MRIVSVGNFRTTHQTEVHIAAALREWNHEVIEYQLSIQNLHRLPAAVHKYRPDFLLWTHTSSLAPRNDLVQSALTRVKKMGTMTAAFHLDRYFDLAREKSLTEEPWWTLCDIVMTADGGNQSRFEELGINHVWMPPAVHGPDTELVGTPRDEYRCKVAFVGSWRNYHPEWPWRLEMIDHLRKRYGDDFRTFPDNSRQPIRGQDLCDLYASVDVVVGDSCFAGMDKGIRYHSDRPYETMGRGGCLVFPRVEGFEESFTDGVHLRYFDAGNPDSMFRVIDELLADPDQRERLKTAGKLEVQTNHLYRHRVSEMVQRIVEHRCALMGWTAEVRPHTWDAVAIRETWLDDVYRAKDIIGPGSLVVDIGGNVGAFTIFAAKLGAEVITAEPLPDNLNQLHRNMEAMGVSGQVTVHPTAVGERDGTIKMSFFDTDHSQSFYRTDEGHIEVPVTTLANIIPRGRTVDFLKVDIEGSEIYALQDADLSNVRHIAIETHNTDPENHRTSHKPVIEIVKKAGFEVTDTGGHTEGYVYGRRK